MKASQSKRLLILIFLATVCTNVSAYGFGARHALPIQKMITLTGSKSAAVAKIFGLGPKGNDHVELRLRGEHDHVFNYLTSDSDQKSYENKKFGFYNEINFSNSGQPSLAIGPFWFDLGTQGPFPKKGKYRFFSKDISVALDDNDPWTQVLQRLKQRPQWSDDTRRKIHIRFNFDHGNKLWIDVGEDYANLVEGENYFIGVTVFLKE